jgi:CBS domain-containing protein/anti-sigma regulatory factor (Ser/Thr protein kinase)
VEGAVPINADDSPAVILDLIYSLKVKDVMSRNVVSAKREDSLRHVQALMRENDVTGVPIAEEGRLFGIVSIDDILTALDKGHIGDPAGSRMTRSVIVLEDDMPLSFAISFLNKYRFRRFPVLDKARRLVGILTSKDVIRALLVEINREVLRLERGQAGRPGAGAAGDMEFRIARYDFEGAGRASTEIKKALKRLGLDPALVRRIAVASYELEINQVVHSQGGSLSCAIRPDSVTILAVDDGPGIADVELAMQEGWSTANEWIRSLGFGAGMGLANAKRVSDEFTIESAVGSGTRVMSVIRIPRDAAEEKEGA